MNPFRRDQFTLWPLERFVRRVELIEQLQADIGWFRYHARKTGYPYKRGIVLAHNTAVDRFNATKFWFMARKSVLPMPEPTPFDDHFA